MSRGKKVGHKKSTIEIQDDSISPYYVVHEEKQYTVMKEGNTLSVGYYSTLSGALNRINALKMLEDNAGDSMTLSSYLKHYEELNQNILNSVKL